VEPDLFGDAADVLRSLLPPELHGAQMRHHRWGLKVWFGDGTTKDPASNEHYEAQVVNKRFVPDAKVIALEVGFHAEHPKPNENERILGVLTGTEKRWRKTLGPDAVAGPFLGRDTWCRLSETWADVDLHDPELAVEIGTRLFDYIVTIEPLRPY
jgi:hypothetical protein